MVADGALWQVKHVGTPGPDKEGNTNPKELEVTAQPGKSCSSNMQSAVVCSAKQTAVSLFCCCCELALYTMLLSHAPQLLQLCTSARLTYTAFPGL